jgi:hypothetical protein
MISDYNHSSLMTPKIAASAITGSEQDFGYKPANYISCAIDQSIGRLGHIFPSLIIDCHGFGCFADAVRIGFFSLIIRWHAYILHMVQV